MKTQLIKISFIGRKINWEEEKEVSYIMERFACFVEEDNVNNKYVLFFVSFILITREQKVNETIVSATFPDNVVPIKIFLNTKGSKISVSNVCY